MNTLKSFAAIGSILATTGCVESEKIPEQTTPVVTLDRELSSLDVRVIPSKEDQGLQKKEDASDPVKIILESNKRYHDAMIIIGPIIRQLNKDGWDGVARCDLDPVIREMRKKNRQLTESVNKATEAVIRNGPPDMELLKCREGTEIADDCDERLNSSELGRILVKEKKASGEYWQTLAACYQKEFKDMPVKKP